MKIKAITATLVILFLASIAIEAVFAAYPTGYYFEQRDTGFSGLSNDQWHSFDTSVKMGTVVGADGGDRGNVVFNGGPMLSDITALSYWTYAVQTGTFSQLTAYISIYLDTDSGKDYNDWVTDYLAEYPGPYTKAFYIQAEPYYTTGNPTLNTWEKQNAFGSTPLTWVGTESPDYPHDAPTLSDYISGAAMSWPVPGHGNQAFASREYGSLYICAIKIRMGDGTPWVNTLAYVDDVTINDYLETFDGPIGQVIPEVPIGTVVASASMLVAFGVYFGFRRHRKAIPIFNS